jgi:type IV secretion system protein VirB9
MRTFIRRLAPALAMFASSVSIAAEVPRPGKLDGRVRFVEYDQHQVVQVAGWLRHSIQIEFAADEDILQVALGNAVAWEAAPVGHILFLKPREHQPSTNMSVVTQRTDGTKRSYQLELATVNGPQQAKLQPFFLVRYQYPGDDAARRKTEAQAKAELNKAGDAERALTAAELGGPRNWSYTVQGDTTFEPVAVFDNGKVTTFTFPQNITMPAIFIVNGDGSESLIPKTAKLTDVVVHAVSQKFVLRSGDEVMCVFNESYVPGGVSTGTLTVAPAVERVTKLALPKAATGTWTPVPVLPPPSSLNVAGGRGATRLAPAQ